MSSVCFQRIAFDFDCVLPPAGSVENDDHEVLAQCYQWCPVDLERAGGRLSISEDEILGAIVRASEIYTMVTADLHLSKQSAVVVIDRL